MRRRTQPLDLEPRPLDHCREVGQKLLVDRILCGAKSIHRRRTRGVEDREHRDLLLDRPVDTASYHRPPRNETQPHNPGASALQSSTEHLARTEEQIAVNQTLFREVNERIRGLNADLSTLTGVMQIVCECGDSACVQSLTMSPLEYEHLRSDATWFAVVPGHAVAHLERVVATHPDYHVVQKRPGAPAAVAEATDPRR